MNLPTENIYQNVSYADDDILLPILAALGEEEYDKVKTILATTHPSDIAELINLCEKDDREKIISILGGLDAEILPFLDSEVIESLGDSINSKSVAKEIEKLESDDAIQFIEELSEEKQDEVLEALSHEIKQELTEALNYPEGSAGRLANKQFITAKATDNVGDVIDILRVAENLPQDFYTIFILDNEGKPSSFIPLSRVIRNQREVPLSYLKQSIVKAIPYNAKQEEVANIFRKYGLISAPVIDDNGKMIGVITVDDIAYVIDEEGEKDLLQLAGLSADADIFSPVKKRFKDRAPWLLVNLFSSLLVTVIISFFESSIQKIVALAALMPVIASLSGISGSQTLTISVRAIATSQLNFNNYFRVLRKEILTAFLNGLFIAFLVMAGSYILYSDIHLSLVMAVAILITFFVSAISGATIPILLNYFKIDPAVASSAIVMAFTDISSFFVFLGLASLFL
jgi:magnesium transporter